MRSKSFKRILLATFLAVQLLGSAIFAQNVHASGAELDIARVRVNTFHAAGGDAFNITYLTDGNPATFWHARWGEGDHQGSGFVQSAANYAAGLVPAYAILDIDLGSVQTVAGIELDKRQSSTSGIVADVVAYIHAGTAATWPGGERTWDDIQAATPGIAQADLDADFDMAGWTAVTATVDGGITPEVGTPLEIEQTVTIDFAAPVTTRYLRLRIYSVAQDTEWHTAGAVHFTQIALVRVIEGEAAPAAPTGGELRFMVDTVNYTLDGVARTAPQASFIQGGSTFVPLRVVAEGLGGTAAWEEATRTAIITVDGQVVRVQEGDGAQAAVNVDGSFFVPLRFVAESFDAEVDWNPTTRTAYVIW